MTFQEALAEQMKDEIFKKEYDALESEYEVISSSIDNKRAMQISPKDIVKHQSLIKQL